MIQPRRLSASTAKVIAAAFVALLLVLLLLAALWQERVSVFPRFFPRVLGTLPYPVTSVAVSPDGRLVAACGGDYVHNRGEARVWELSSGRLLRVLSLTRAQPWSLAFSPDSQNLAVGTAFPEGAVRLWDTQTGQVRLLVPGNPASWNKSKRGGWTTGLVFSPDGTRLAANGNGTLALYDVASGKRLWNLTNRNQDGTVLAFSPDGKTLASAAPIVYNYPPVLPKPTELMTQGQAQLLDTATGKVLASFPNPPNVLAWAAAFSPDGRYLAVGSDKMAGGGILGGTLHVYSLPDRKLIWNNDNRPSGFDALRFSPSGRLIAAEEPSESLSLWNAQTGKALSRIAGQARGWSDSPDVLAFTPDGRLLAHRQGNAVQIWQTKSLR